MSNARESKPPLRRQPRLAGYCREQFTYNTTRAHSAAAKAGKISAQLSVYQPQRTATPYTAVPHARHISLLQHKNLLPRQRSRRKNRTSTACGQKISTALPFMCHTRRQKECLESPAVGLLRTSAHAATSRAPHEQNQNPLQSILLRRRGALVQQRANHTPPPLTPQKKRDNEHRTLLTPQTPVVAKAKTKIKTVHARSRHPTPSSSTAAAAAAAAAAMAAGPAHLTSDPPSATWIPRLPRLRKGMGWPGGEVGRKGMCVCVYIRVCVHVCVFTIAHAMLISRRHGAGMCRAFTGPGSHVTITIDQYQLPLAQRAGRWALWQRMPSSPDHSPLRVPTMTGSSGTRQAVARPDFASQRTYI